MTVMAQQADDVEAAMLEGWIETAARLLRAGHDPNVVFRTMTAVAVAGLLRSWPPDDAARFLREIADGAEARRDPATLLDAVGRILFDSDRQA